MSTAAENLAARTAGNRPLAIGVALLLRSGWTVGGAWAGS